MTSLSVVATVVAMVGPKKRPLVPMGVVLRFAVAASVTAGLILMPVMIRGTSASAVLNGVLIRPAQFAELFHLPLILPATSLLTAFAGAAISLAFALSVKLGYPPRPLIVAAAKLLTAVAGLYLSRIGYMHQIAYFTAFLWVVALSSDNSGRGPTTGRAILALLAVFQALQAYPVAGSQLAFATFLMVPVAFVCA